MAETAANEVRPSAFWGTFPAAHLSADNRWLVAKRFDDTGRALFLGLAFRALGGAAPYLIFWLGVLAALPILIWVALELAAVRQAVAGAIFVVAVSSSAFVLDALSLGYSAIGFHIVALLGLLPLAVYGVLDRKSVV